MREQNMVRAYADGYGLDHRFGRQIDNRYCVANSQRGIQEAAIRGNGQSGDLGLRMRPVNRTLGAGGDSTENTPACFHAICSLAIRTIRPSAPDA